MTFLPIVARELRVASRRAATYWTRFTGALLAIVVASLAWALLLGHSPRETGLTLFITLSVIAYVYSLLAGTFATADCVSEEKREGTLGLLFLTDLRSYDIVLGKLAASSVSGVYGLLAIFPIMGIPLLLGGVAPSEFWRVVLVCVNNLFLSLALGMICSTVCKDERRAIGLTVIIVLMLTAGWPAFITWLPFTLDASGAWRDFFGQHLFSLYSPSPGFACVFAFDATYQEMLKQTKFNWFYVSLAFNHALGWLALMFTTLLLPLVWQDRAATPHSVRRRERWRLWTDGTKEVRAAFRRQLLEVNPFYWLASRDRFKVMLVWLWLGAGAALWMFGLTKERHSWLDNTVYVWTALLAHSSLKCWLAMEASRRLGEDRRSGALELLLSTPLSVPDILRGQWLALLRQFGAAAALVVAVDFLFLGLGLKHTFEDRTSWTVMWLAGAGIFIFDLVTLTLLAMWGSLSGRKSNQAGLSAIVRVCVLPWFLLGVVVASLAIMEEVFRFRPFGTNVPDYWIILLWFVISLATDALLAGWALRRLRADFRTVATQRIESQATIWGRWLGKMFTTKK